MKGVSLCHPVSGSCPSALWGGQGGATVSVSGMARVKRGSLCPSVNDQLCVNLERGFCVNMTTPFPVVPLPAKLCFLQIISFPGFWNNICGECATGLHPGGEKCCIFHVLSVERRPRSQTWPPDLAIVSRYLTVLISFLIFPPLFSHLFREVIVKRPYLPQMVAVYLT